MKPLYIVCVLFVALGSCSKKLDLPETGGESKIALLGELVANETVYFRGGQSVPVSTNSSMSFQTLNGLSVNMTDGTGASVALSGTEDTLSRFLYTIPFTSGITVKPASTYRITATHPKLGTATTDVAIPAAFKAAVVATSNATIGSDTFLAIDLSMEDQAGEHYYVVEAVKQPFTITGQFLFDNQWLDISSNRLLYDSLKTTGAAVPKQFDTSFSNTYVRQSLRTDDANTENMKNNSSSYLFRRILLSDYKFSGSTYNTLVYLRINQDFFASESDKGRVLLQVKSVSKDYFDYLKAYELYSPNADYFMSGTPVNLKSPVQNGMGVIGGVYKQQFIFVLDKWEF